MVYDDLKRQYPNWGNWAGMMVGVYELTEEIVGPGSWNWSPESKLYTYHCNVIFVDKSLYVKVLFIYTRYVPFELDYYQ